MNNAEVLVKFKGDTSSLDKSTKEATSTITNLAKSITLGTLATKGITKAIEVFNSGLDGAISRADTMNNFPKVMSNLGISAGEASEVVKDLSEKLRGLPTSLDKATNSVQRLTTKTGDVKKAEKIFLALNNAIIAGGASSDIQANAMEQISQSFAKGKPDMMEWRSMMTAMPAQLKQVADAMGYVNVADLGTAIREDGGEAEFARMIETMVKMNTVGVGSFKSFEEQARNATGGISVSATNMRTAIVRGISNMLNSINQATQQFGGISGILSTIGKTAEKIFTKIGELFAIIFPKIVELFTYISNHKDELILIGTIIAGWKIASYVQKGVQAFQMMRVTLSLLRLEMGTTSTVSAILKYGLSGLKTAFSSLWAVIMENPITIIVGLIIGLIAGFVYLWNHCEAFRNFWINIWNDIKLKFAVTIENIKAFFRGLVNFFTGIPGELKQIGSNMIKGLIDGVNGMKDKAVGAVKNVGKNLLSGMKNVLGIHSPSKEFGIIGKFSVLGYTEALDNMSGEVDKAINSTFGLSPNLTNTASLHYSPNVVVNNDVNISQDPLGQMVSNIKSFSGGAKNDYSFGLGE